MKRAKALLVSALLAVSALAATAPSAAALRGSVWSNSDAFTARCLGFTDRYPQLMYDQATTQLKKLGYSWLGGSIGPGFTRAAFLGEVLSDFAVYVHSHGDNYWAASGRPNVDSGFLQDPGASRCNSASDIVRSSAIKAATLGTPYNLVIMSTCALGSSTSTMPDAFQIARTKGSTDREFYLGYANSVYDSSAYRFEGAFFAYLTGGTPHTRTAASAFAYAMSIGGYAIPDSSNPFTPNWWGSPNYDGMALW
jgi:hypothetical protein